MKEDALYYVGQKAFIKKGDEVLVLADSRWRVDYPGGKIQEHETDLIESLKREVMEETGLEINVGEPFATWNYIIPSEHRLAGNKLFLVGYKCDYVSGEVKMSDEHSNFSWVTKDNYKKLDDGNTYFKILEKYFAD